MLALVFLSMLAGLYGIVFNLRAVLALLHQAIDRSTRLRTVRSVYRKRRA